MNAEFSVCHNLVLFFINQKAINRSRFLSSNRSLEVQVVFLVTRLSRQVSFKFMSKLMRYLKFVIKTYQVFQMQYSFDILIYEAVSRLIIPILWYTPPNAFMWLIILTVFCIISFLHYHFAFYLFLLYNWKTITIFRSCFYQL